MVMSYCDPLLNVNTLLTLFMREGTETKLRPVTLSAIWLATEETCSSSQLMSALLSASPSTKSEIYEKSQ